MRRRPAQLSPSTRRDASAAERPSAICLRIASTRETSASEYSRNLPGERSGSKSAVAPLPGSQELGADTGSPAELADADVAARHGRRLYKACPGSGTNLYALRRPENAPRWPFRDRCSNASVSSPSIASARRRMFVIPSPLGTEESSKPTPSSDTSTTRRPVRWEIETSTWRASAWRRALPSPSCTIRKTSICSSGASRTVGSTSSSTSRAPSAVRTSTYRRSAESKRAEPPAGDSARTAKRASCCAVMAACLRRGSTSSSGAPDSSMLTPRRDREEVLRETVVDVPRDARPLVRDGAPELCVADRSPDADDEDPVRENVEEVALEQEVARQDRGEDEVQVREDRERRREAHPAVEVASMAAIAEPEPDGRDEPERRERRCGEPDVRALDQLTHRAQPWRHASELRARRPRAARRRRHRSREAHVAARPACRSRTPRRR